MTSVIKAIKKYYDIKAQKKKTLEEAKKAAEDAINNKAWKTQILADIKNKIADINSLGEYKKLLETTQTDNLTLMSKSGVSLPLQQEYSDLFKTIIKAIDDRMKELEKIKCNAELDALKKQKEQKEKVYKNLEKVHGKTLKKIGELYPGRDGSKSVPGDGSTPCKDKPCIIRDRLNNQMNEKLKEINAIQGKIRQKKMCLKF